MLFYEESFLLFLFVSAADVRQWECIAYCLSQLTFSEKGLKKLIDLFKAYEHSLCEDSVMDYFRVIINKVTRNQLYLSTLVICFRP